VGTSPYTNGTRNREENLERDLDMGVAVFIIFFLREIY
jgi:hypothetical protein